MKSRKSYLLFLTILFIGLQHTLFGQNACFTLDVTRGCAPLTITAHDCSGESNIGYLFGEGQYSIFDPDDYTTDSVYTFDTAGTYTVFQLVPPGGNPIDSIHVEVLEAPAPLFDLSLCADTSVNISITDMAYEEYFIEFGDGQFDTLVSGQLINHGYGSPGSVTIKVTGNYVPGNCGSSDSQTVVLITELLVPTLSLVKDDTGFLSQIQHSSQSNVLYEIQSSISDTNGFTKIDSFLATSVLSNISITSTSGSQICYRTRAYDLCGNEQFSNPVCIVRPNVVASNDFNTVSWDQYASTLFSNFQLYKDSVLFGTYNANSSYSEVDSQTICGIENCYYLITTLTNGNTAESNDSCVFGVSSKIQDTLELQSTYNTANEIEFNWKQPIALFQQFTLSNSSADIVTSADSTIAFNTTHDCFTIRFNDLCDNVSENSEATCPILLAGTVDFERPNEVSLEWSEYVGWTNGVSSYEIQVLDETNSILLTRFAGTNTNMLDTIDYTFNLQNYRYRIKAIENDVQGRVSYSNIESVQIANSLFIPNTFSPNGDEHNNVFYVRARFAESIKINIYDRWNNIAFATTQLNEGWDGTYPDGNAAPAGVYTYYVEVTDQNGRTQTRKWTLTLIR